MPWYKKCWSSSRSQPWRRGAITILRHGTSQVCTRMSCTGKKKKKSVIYREVESTTSLQPPQRSSKRLWWKIAEAGAVFSGFLFTPVNLSAWCLLSKRFCPTTAPDGKQCLFQHALQMLCYSQWGEGNREVGVHHSRGRSEDHPPDLRSWEVPATWRTPCRRHTCRVTAGWLTVNARSPQSKTFLCCPPLRSTTITNSAALPVVPPLWEARYFLAWREASQNY